MGKLSYLIYRKVSEIGKNWKRYIFYLIIFYIGILLPTFCWAYYSGIRHTLKYFEIPDVNEKVLLTWFSSTTGSFFEKYDDTTPITVYKRTFLPDGSIVTLTGINSQNIPFNNEEGIKYGATIELSDIENEERVCVINKETAEKMNLKVGGDILLEDNSYKIKGISEDIHYKNVIYIPMTTFSRDIMITEEEYQFDGIFTLGPGKTSRMLGESLQKELKNENIEYSRFTSGTEYWENINRSINKSKNQQVIIATGAALFFLVNSIIVLISKMEDEKKNTAIRIVMGSDSFSELVSSFVETILVSIAAVVLCLLSMRPLEIMMSLDGLIRVDGYTVAGVVITVISAVIIINIIMFWKTSSLELAVILNSGE